MDVCLETLRLEMGIGVQSHMSMVLGLWSHANDLDHSFTHTALSFLVNVILYKKKGLWCLIRHFQQYFSYVSFIDPTLMLMKMKYSTSVISLHKNCHIYNNLEREKK
jgi:hypothetical protein